MYVPFRCPECFSRQISWIYEKWERDGLGGHYCCYFGPMYYCKTCDHEFMTYREFSRVARIRREFKEYIRKDQFPSANHYFSNIVEHDPDPLCQELSLRQVSELKSLAVLRMTHGYELTLQIRRQVEFLNLTNPVLFELETIINKIVPRLDVMLPAQFGYLATDHSILGLNLSDQDLFYLPHRVCLFPNLRELYVHDNSIKHLPDQIGDLKRLEALYLHNNQLISLPDTITQLHNLKELSLDSTIKLTERQKYWLKFLKTENSCVITINLRL